jgi:hypothetical protein
MQIKTSLLSLFMVGAAHAAVISRITTFSDGSILYSSDLNAEFNNIVNTVNSLDNANLASNANISPAKLNPIIAGDALGVNSTTSALEVKTDGSTMETSGDAIRVKDVGITTAKLALSSVTTQIIADSSVTTAKLAAGAVTGAVIADGSITTAKLADANVTTAKLALNSVTTQLIADSSITHAKLSARTQQSVTASVGNVADGISTGSFTHATTTITPVTNATVTITTTGRPVLVKMESADIGTGDGKVILADQTGDGFVTFNVLFRRGGGTQQVYNMGGLYPADGFVYYPCSSLQFTDFPSAGTVTYTLEVANAQVGTDTISVFDCKMVAYEL